MESESPRLVAGIDLGATSVKIGVLEPEGRILHWESYPTNPGQGAESSIDEMAERLQRLFSRKGIGSDRIMACGIGSPGPLDLDNGTIVTTPNLGWKDVPIRDMLSRRLGRPVVLENDAVAATFGECWIGAGRPYHDVVGITLGTGVGGGIVLGDRIHHGARGIAGHIGHMSIRFDGRRCGCGNRGCLEAYVSASAIIARTREALDGGAESALAGNAGELTSKGIFEAARQGDALACSIFRDTGKYLGIGILNLLNLLDPQAVIIMGAVANAGDWILEPLKETLRELSFPGIADSTAVMRGELGETAGLVGAARCALEEAQPS